MACTPDIKALYNTWLCRLVGMRSRVSGSTSLAFVDGDSPGEKSRDFWSVSPRGIRSADCPPETSLDAFKESPGLFAIESSIGSSVEPSLEANA